MLGRAYLADGRLNEARAELEAVLALDRENVVALKALAGILSHQGDHEKASGYYRAVCRIDPGDLESQTALHQITSGEFPEVRPADVVVGQGDLSWQPVRLPREEEHLPELGLGLRTIETFDAPPPRAPYTAKVQDFQEVKLERAPKWVDEGETASAIVKSAEATAPEAPPATERAPMERRPAPPAERAPSDERVPVSPPPSQAVPAPSESGDADSAPPKRVQGNRSAFEQWVSRLGGKES